MNFVPTFSFPPASRFSTTAFLLVISNHLIWCFNRSVFFSAYFFQWLSCSSLDNGASSTFSATSANTTSNLPLRLAPAFSNSAYTALIELLNSSKLLAICSLVTLSLPSKLLATLITSSFFATAFSTAGFASILTSFLRIASLASTLVTSASEVTWVNSFLASLTSVDSFASAFAFSSAFLASSFTAFPVASDSATTVVSTLSVVTLVFTSSWLASAFANTSFAFANSSRAVFNATSSAFLALANFFSNLSIAAFKAAFVWASVLTSALGVSTATFSSICGLSSTTASLAETIPPAKKNIPLAIITLATPWLNLRIPKRWNCFNGCCLLFLPISFLLYYSNYNFVLPHYYTKYIFKIQLFSQSLYILIIIISNV